MPLHAGPAMNMCMEPGMRLLLEMAKDGTQSWHAMSGTPSAPPLPPTAHQPITRPPEPPLPASPARLQAMQHARRPPPPGMHSHQSRSAGGGSWHQGSDVPESLSRVLHQMQDSLAQLLNQQHHADALMTQQSQADHPEMIEQQAQGPPMLSQQQQHQPAQPYAKSYHQHQKALQQHPLAPLTPWQAAHERAMAWQAEEQWQRAEEQRRREQPWMPGIATLHVPGAGQWSGNRNIAPALLQHSQYVKQPAYQGSAEPGLPGSPSRMTYDLESPTRWGLPLA